MQRTWRRLGALLTIGVVGFMLSAPVMVSAAAKPSTAKTATPTRNTENISQSVARSYNADPAVQLGMIVKLKEKDTGTVEPDDQSHLKALLGVIVKPNDSTITLSPQDAKTQQVYVASSGQFTTLVTNQNGAIKAGDSVTVSAIAGLGMKADANQQIILGKAITPFTGTANVIGKVSIKDSAGKSHDVAVGRITVAIDISHNPLAAQENDKAPEFLRKAALGIVGKPVSTARIYLGVVTLIVAAFVAANLVYSGVKSGMVAIGRNPLSRKSIIKSLIQTVVAGLIVFLVGILSVYLLLKV